MNDILYYLEFFWIGILLLSVLGVFIRGYWNVLFYILTGVGVFYSGGGFKETGVVILVSLGFKFIYGVFFSGDKKSSKKSSPFKVEILDHRKKKVIIDDINRGVTIFAASGGGKSAGPIYWLTKHFAKEKFAGLVNDYKDYELTEVIYPLFKKNGVDLKVWAVHDVNRSVRINPLDPKYIKTESDLVQIVSCLMLNLFDSVGGNAQFFVNAGASVFSAVAWRLKESYPEKCNIPFVISILLSFNNLHELDDNGNITRAYGKLLDFICESRRATILGNMFLSGLSNERQTGSVMSSLADGLSKLASPELFYLLGEDEFSLDLNASNNRTVLSMINYPKKEMFISPINAMVTECCFGQMSERGREPAFIMLDEAPTLKLAKLGKKVSTLRSYKIAFVYCLQDKIQGLVQWEGREYIIKEVLSNLSVQFFGKINDPETGKYYEKYFDMIKEQQMSYNKGRGGLFEPAKGEERVTTSFKDVSLFKSFEFFKLVPGEFVMFASGIAKKFRFFYEEPEKEMPLPCRQMTPTELDVMYEEILKNGAEFLSTRDKIDIVTTPEENLEQEVNYFDDKEEQDIKIEQEMEEEEYTL